MLKQKCLPFLASFFCIFMQSALFCMQVKYKQLEERKISAAQHTEMTENHDPIFDGTRLPVEVQDLIKEYAFDCSDYLPFCTFYRRSIPRAHDKTIFIDETCLAVGSYYDHYVRVWELKTLKCKWELPHHGTVLAVTKIGNTLITGCSSGILYRWNLITGKPETALKLFNDTIHTLINDDENHVIVAASGDENIYSVDLRTGNISATFAAESPCICVFKAYIYIFVLNKKGKMTAWNLVTQEKITIPFGNTTNTICYTCLLKFKENRAILMGLKDGTIHIWNPEEDPSIKILRGHTAPVFFAYQISRNNVETYSYDGTIKRWDLTTSTCHATTTPEFPAMFTCYTIKLKSGKKIIVYADGVIQKYSQETRPLDFLETRRSNYAHRNYGCELSYDNHTYLIYEKNSIAQRLLYNLPCAMLLQLPSLLGYIQKQCNNNNKSVALTKKLTPILTALPEELKKCLNTHYTVMTKKPVASACIIS